MLRQVLRGVELVRNPERIGDEMVQDGAKGCIRIRPARSMQWDGAPGSLSGVARLTATTRGSRTSPIPALGGQQRHEWVDVG
jgi:hypothetical protein